MATRKLNKKVALIGSAVFVVLVAAAIALVLYLNRDPQKFIEDGDAAIQAAREVTDELIKNEKYKSAERSYHQARALAKADSLRIKIIFKLAELYREIGQWRDVMGCWNEISRLDTKDHVARFGRLKYLYLMADRQTIDFDPFPTDARTSDQERLGPYAYLVRGRAMLEIARSGAATDVEQVLSKAVKDLEKAQELDESANTTLSRFLAAAMVTQGEIYASRSEVEKKDETVKQALELLQHTAELAGTDPEPQISLLGVKLALALRSDVDQVEQKVLSLEPQYLELVKKFPDSPQAFHALAGFYRMSVKNLDKAVEAGQTAAKLDKENIAYVQRTARLHYSKFCIYGDKSGLDAAIQMAKSALTLPAAQDEPGPREWAGRMNRVSLFALLAECYIEQLLTDQQTLNDEQRQRLLEDAEQTVMEIEHLFGIGEAPQVIKWRGLLELAQGKTDSAIKKLYNAYEQLKAVDQKDSLLSYRLARFFQDTTELGAAKEFYESALRRTEREGGVDEKKPEALLDYARLLLSLGDYNTTLNIIDFFERKYWANQSSAQIRLDALIRAGQFDEVQKELAKMGQNDPNAMMFTVALLQARIRQEQRALAQEQMKQDTPLLFEEPELDANQPPQSLQVISDQLRAYWADLASLLQKMLETEPNAVRETSIVALCNHYVSDGKTTEARALIDEFLKIFPDRPTLAFYQRMLAEPQPTQIPQNRRRQLEEQALSSITDPVRRAMNLGRFYHRNDELEKAAAEFEKVIEMQDTLVGIPAAQKETSSEHRRLAASYLFEIALTSKDWELASQIAEKARLQDLDDCQGRFFAARLDVAMKEYQGALANCNECLKYRPVFSHAYILRSNVYDAMGNNRL
ncbi:MAG: tetratricopeptide repeat protein, partial [Planctomycetota bacterium]